MNDFIQQVQFNCQIAAAGQVGFYSLCGMLLRMRQLYKWEQNLLPWQEGDPKAVLDWIETQEESWSGLEETGLQDLPLNGIRLDPFSVSELNDLLLPEGLAYGAGYTHGLAPTCFLGELWEVQKRRDLTVFILGPELARDLDGSPAMRQGQIIYLRTEPLAFYLWDNLSDPTKQNNFFLKIALAAQGIDLTSLVNRPEEYQDQFQTLLQAQGEAMIHHEIGEALEPSLQKTFAVIIGRLPHTRVERYVRALKDTLADLNDWGRVQHLLEQRNLPGLALLLAWRPGFYPYLVPELEPAFWALQKSRDWNVMHQARQEALERLRRTAAELDEVLAELAEKSDEELATALDNRFIKPLGL
ncbi:Sfum_1244 family protein [Desulfobacca acetoxidans]|uniref:Uncharacterized protein n=1 Tax=Desulfobacca acetoxidans (strain ATCC 700848 / DSM 11109 / ASRB2) TaxID=880072 RepID=F2NDA4_DESAR|nr:Sfum_1244 family protein [Desulfobacca acetoxidans]AEB09970.1 hypothetical protein Desac_2141 [Desulfobacca acetoxidans DSM 11109]